MFQFVIKNRKYSHYNQKNIIIGLRIDLGRKITFVLINIIKYVWTWTITPYGNWFVNVRSHREDFQRGYEKHKKIKTCEKNIFF